MTIALLLKIFAIYVLVAVALMFLGVITVALPNTAFAWVAFAVASWWLSQFITA